MIKIGVVEDNIEEMRPLIDFLEQYFGSKSLKYEIFSFDSSEAFLEKCDFDYNLLFFDIELPGIDGMELARRYREHDNDAVLVFVTNMAQYAINGYEVEAHDFIVKPIKEGLLSMKLDRVIDKLSMTSNDKIVISIDRQPRVFLFDSIAYIETSNHNINISMNNGETYKARASLSSLDKQFIEHNFYRVSSYALVNLKYVTGMDHDDILVGKARIRVSRPKKKDFMSALSNYLGRN